MASISITGVSSIVLSTSTVAGLGITTSIRGIAQVVTTISAAQLSYLNALTGVSHIITTLSSIPLILPNYVSGVAAIVSDLTDVNFITQPLGDISNPGYTSLTVLRGYNYG